jgi:hypothetical protein
VVSADYIDRLLLHIGLMYSELRESLIVCVECISDVCRALSRQFRSVASISFGVLVVISLCLKVPLVFQEVVLFQLMRKACGGAQREMAIHRSAR